jgi:DNA-directed RNA polymerase
MIAGICETLKYTVKENDLVGKYCKDDDTNSTWLKKITEQLYKSRKVEYRGVLKEIGKQLESAYDDDDLIKINDEQETTEDGPLPEMIFTWKEAIARYVLRDDNSQE